MKAKPQPLEPGDFYFNEQGLMVFTAQYHQRRGFCCQSGCKHCPFGFRKTDPSSPASGSKNGPENG
ncbi:hypothetical protein TH63_15840 [Rufibacter radiotolerans]|uniref:Uncharacterized protein n=1 Tax=Rufibacter radiotolerans TaxID=1379910 RepID=A0A0H4VLS2_9BACT|nr:DUF5522 domain-containing protein [Rufibacter radiotolerans]AKQ46760.1 hypothetical protein TH63_15840 [Rufibacter radiotolerans]